VSSPGLEALLPSLDETPGARAASGHELAAEDPTRVRSERRSACFNPEDVTGGGDRKTVATERRGTSHRRRWTGRGRQTRRRTERNQGPMVIAAAPPLVVILGIGAAVFWRNQGQPAQEATDVTSPAPPPTRR